MLDHWLSYTTCKSIQTLVVPPTFQEHDWCNLLERDLQAVILLLSGESKLSSFFFFKQSTWGRCTTPGDWLPRASVLTQKSLDTATLTSCSTEFHKVFFKVLLLQNAKKEEKKRRKEGQNIMVNSVNAQLMSLQTKRQKTQLQPCYSTTVEEKII